MGDSIKEEENIWNFWNKKVAPYLEIIKDDTFGDNCKLNKKGEKKFPMWKDRAMKWDAILRFVLFDGGVRHPFEWDPKMKYDEKTKMIQ